VRRSLFRKASVQDQQKKPRILVAEDEIAIALEIEAHLLDAGYAIVGLASEALEIGPLMESGPVDIAVIDVGMLGPSSDAVTQIVEGGVPCIFMTGYQDADLPRWLPAGDKLAKPFHMPDLLEKIASRLVVGADEVEGPELSA
jgi:DNA-binding response OmpR family regulator